MCTGQVYDGGVKNGVQALMKQILSVYYVDDQQTEDVANKDFP